MKSSPRMFPIERRIPTPREIVLYLNEYVIGQDHAKRVMATSAYHHLKRCALPKAKKNRLKKSNVLLWGPTGCGKTYLAQKLAEFLQIPFAITDATDYTQVGYHGKDVELMVAELLLKSHHSVEEAQKGIVFIDEIDKIASRSQGNQATGFRDIGGEGVQQALLKMLEGREMMIPTNLSQQWNKQELVQIDTSDILFIAAGTFSGIKRPDQVSSVGFTSKEEAQQNKNMDTQDFLQFGLIAELLGRLPIRLALQPLTEDQLVDILVEPPDSLVKEYQYLLELDDVCLQFEESALRQIAKKAQQKGAGARGLRALMEQVCQDVMFEAPERKGETLLIDESFVVQQLQ